MKLKITVAGRTYEVDVEAAEPDPPPTPRGYRVESSPVRVPAAAAAPAAAPRPELANEGKVCRSPVSGVVVRVPAQPGQNIQSGDVLLVLEAMKMETNITAPVAGRIKTVTANAGDSVQAGQVLVEFE